MRFVFILKLILIIFLLRISSAAQDLYQLAPQSRYPENISSVLKQENIYPIDISPGSSTDSRIIQAYHRIASALQKIRIPADGDGPIHLILTNDLSPNAMFLHEHKGEKAVVVHLGLLQLFDSDDQLVFILGHELEHGLSEIDQHHSKDAFLYRRVTENEVDVKSVLNRMQNRGYNPHEAYTAMKKLKEQLGDSPSVSHTLTSTRQDVLEVVLTALRRGLGKQLPPETQKKHEIITSELKTIFSDARLLETQKKAAYQMIDEAAIRHKQYIKEISISSHLNEIQNRSEQKLSQLFYGLEETLTAPLKEYVHKKNYLVLRDLILENPSLNATVAARLLEDIKKKYSSYYLSEPIEVRKRLISSFLLQLDQSPFLSPSGKPGMGWGRDGIVRKIISEILEDLTPGERENEIFKIVKKRLPEIYREEPNTETKRAVASLFELMIHHPTVSVQGLERRTTLIKEYIDHFITVEGYQDAGQLVELMQSTKKMGVDSTKVFSNHLTFHQREKILGVWKSLISRVGDGLEMRHVVMDIAYLKSLGVQLESEENELRSFFINLETTNTGKILRELEWNETFHDLSTDAIRDRMRILLQVESSHYHRTRLDVGNLKSLSKQAGLGIEQTLDIAFRLKIPLPLTAYREEIFSDIPETEILEILKKYSNQKNLDQFVDLYSVLNDKTKLKWINAQIQDERSKTKNLAQSIRLIATLRNHRDSYKGWPLLLPYLEHFEKKDKMEALFRLWRAQKVNLGAREFSQFMILTDLEQIRLAGVTADEMRALPIQTRLQLVDEFNHARNGQMILKSDLFWDLFIEDLMNEVSHLPKSAQNTKLIEPLMDPQLVGSLVYREDQLKLAQMQLDHKTALPTLKQKNLPKEKIRDEVQVIKDRIEKQFPSESFARDEIINRVEKQIHSTKAENEFFLPLRQKLSAWHKSPEIVAIELPEFIHKSFRSQEDRYGWLLYLLGVREKAPEHVVSAVHRSHRYYDAHVSLASFRQQFQASDPMVRALILQPLLDEQNGLLADSDKALAVQKLILGNRSEDPLLKSMFESYIQASPAAERRLVLSHILSSFVDQGSGHGVSTAKILEGMGPFGVKAGQFLRSSGLVSRELEKELDHLLDSALPPHRVKIYEDLKKFFGDSLESVQSVNELIGSGSVNYVVQAQIKNPKTGRVDPVVIRVQRDYVEGLVANENAVWQGAIEKLGKSPNPKIKKLALVIEEARKSTMTTLSAGGMELDLGVERQNYSAAVRAYERTRAGLSSEAEIHVAQPIDELQRLIPSQYQSQVSVYEYIENTPLKNVVDSKKRADLAQSIIRSEMSALLEEGVFDPDGQRGNWLYDEKKHRLVRIDYAQLRTLTPEEREAIQKTLSLLLRPKLKQEDVKNISSHLKRIFVLETVSNAEIEKALMPILQDASFPGWKAPMERLFVIRSTLEKNLSQKLNHQPLRLREGPRAGFASVGKMMGYQEYMNSMSFARSLTKNLDISTLDFITAEVQERVQKLGRSSLCIMDRMKGLLRRQRR